MESLEPQYNSIFRDFEQFGPVFLAPMVSSTWRNDPKRLGMKLSRYKAVAKLISGSKQVLEIGIGDGWSSKLICHEVQAFTASDFDSVWKLHVENSLKDEKSFTGFLKYDPTKDDFPLQKSCFDAVVALDVLEHIDPQVEPIFLKNISTLLEKDGGVAIFGMPSRESQLYASEGSKAGHINCQSGQELKTNLEKFFHRVMILSFNDETIHTGFYPMSHYLLAVCFGSKFDEKTKIN